MSINLIGRDSRTLSKLFEEIVNSPDDYVKALVKAKEVFSTPQKKFIQGLKY
ncbi:MAG: hypothetical protein QG623_464 [Patescibacteria group bacterium]|nr:hypothetical protein [Patescibacteria group bacterium]